MTKEAIIEEIKKHSPEEQREIFEAVLAPIKKDDELTPEDIAVADARRKQAEEKPETVMSEQQFWTSVRTLTQK
ncbi:MAG: hypothetical protein R6V86_01605 [Spirochaetia bacterium]